MPRTADHPVDDLFLKRWSPRAFDGSEMPDADLKTVLEAARWAPSAFNVQPWRFVYARRGEPAFDTLFGLLDDFNQGWAGSASALVFLFSDTLVDGVREDGPVPSAFHAFDAGGAWAQAALQATSLGYHSHAMAGLRRDEIHQALGVPERLKAEIAFAIGRQGDKAQLADDLRSQETPSGRKPLSDIAFSGRFPARLSEAA
ncbi:nitroreductase family protein [Labrenzia sp. PHM005]|uniref:nitroreductase family protein n=1 Tax=Labrenzia sp. PHM005 TaxID=2590016 RepID=UPI0011401250|nr:nitroreductase family protein [Labrenzia sp. PHM005]QDG78572.1 nitroreductase family protein [Labrenzia sp. PHM005]